MKLFKVKSAKYFECYYHFIENRTACSVDQLLCAAKSVNEALKNDTHKSIKYFRDSNDFQLIRMLRNFNEHAGDVVSDFKMIDKLATDELKPELGFLCLISSKQFDSAKYGKEVSREDIPKIDSAASIVGSYIDIHPAFFNFSVCVYEVLIKYGLSLETKDFLSMKASYEKEKIHNINHYIVPRNYPDTLVFDGRSIEEHIVPFEASNNNVDGLPDYNLMTGLDQPLDISTINFDDIAKNFKRYIKCLNGKPISYYENNLIEFENFSSNNLLSPLKHVLSYSNNNFEEAIIHVGAWSESTREEEIRNKLLNYNFSAILAFGDKYMTKCNSTYDLILYFSILLCVQFGGLEQKESNVLLKIMNSKSRMEVAKALGTIRNNKSAMQKLSFSIYHQMVLLLIEFPFKDHQNK